MGRNICLKEKNTFFWKSIGSGLFYIREKVNFVYSLFLDQKILQLEILNLSACVDSSTNPFFLFTIFFGWFVFFFHNIFFGPKTNLATTTFGQKNKVVQKYMWHFFKNCIGATIHICWDIQCLRLQTILVLKYSF